MVYSEMANLHSKTKEVTGLVLSEGVHTESKTFEIKTQLYDEHYNTKTGETTIIHNGESNLIVTDFSKLVGALLKIEAGFTGIQFWAVGEGEWSGSPISSSWDSLTVEQRTAKSIVSLTNLFTEKARVAVSMSFIDSSATVVSGPTDRIQIRATFGQSISGYLREFGLFGGNATTTLDTGLMLDHKAHSVISHNIGSADMILTRTLNLQL